MVNVAVVDSGAPVLKACWLLQQRRFVVDEQVVVGEVVPDALGHGSAVMAIIRHHAPSVNIINAQVLDAKGRCHTEQLVSALEWLLTLPAMHIHLSLGLRTPSDALREVCDALIAAGSILVASSPAMGEPVFPAALPGVLSVTGDARCAVKEWSWFQTEGTRPEYGAHVQWLQGLGGASIAAAHLSGIIATYRQRYPHATVEEVIAYLQYAASRKGEQKREPLSSLSTFSR